MCVFVCVCRDEEYFATHSKKELIETAKMIAKASTELVKQARQIANKCPDKRMRHVRPKNISSLLSVTSIVFISWRTWWQTWNSLFIFVRWRHVILIFNTRTALNLFFTFCFFMQDLLLTIDRIPTIATQLKILATVKATMFGANGNYISPLLL